jgi:hypothetical protein
MTLGAFFLMGTTRKSAGLLANSVRAEDPTDTPPSSASLLRGLVMRQDHVSGARSDAWVSVKPEIVENNFEQLSKRDS